MLRTQIQLEDEQARALKRLAVDRGVSVAALIREGVDEVLSRSEGDRRWQRALSVVGAGRGGEADVAAQHDRHLADAQMDWRSS